MNICKKCIHAGVCYMQKESVTQCHEFDKAGEYNRKHGRWSKVSPAGIYECSNCQRHVMTENIEAYKFCFNCDSIMDEVHEE